MEKIYKAKDGRIFSGEHADKDCIAYEKSLDEKELSRKQLHEELEKAKADCEEKYKLAQESYKIYSEKMIEFNKKYGAYHTKITANDVFPIFLFDRIFGW